MQCGVGRVGRIGQCRWRGVPSFGFVGSNLAFRAALAEAANTGLALGFSGPNASPQYWLRGTKYSNFLGVPGATYTRTGNRAGLDAAVVYSANVPRIAPSLGPGPELYSNQVGTFDNSAGGATASYNSGTQTVSVTVAGSDIVYPRLRYSLGIVSGRSYRVTGRIDGARTGVNLIRLATSGSANNVAYNSTTGVFDGIVTANGTALEFAFNGTITGDRTIAALSVQEYRDAGSGLRVHGAGTNEARNTVFTGAVAGVMGSGGVAPTGNVVSPGITGLTSEIIGLFTVSDQTVLRLKLSGTASSASGMILFGPNIAGSAPAATQTSIVSQFSWLRLHAGSLATLTLMRQVTEARDASNVRQNLLGGSDLRGSINSTLTRYAADNITIGGGATVTKVTTGIEVTWANGAVIDFTLDIGVNQVEFAAFSSDFIPNPNTGASSSAGADDAVLGTAAGVTLGADHAILVEGIVPDLIAGAFPDFIGWSASSSSVGIFVNASGSNLGVAAGGGTINLTGGPTLTKGQVVRALFRVSGGNTGRLFVNGVAAFANTAFTPSTGLTSFFLGQTPSKTALLGSSLNIAAILPRAPSDAECLAITAP